MLDKDNNGYVNMEELIKRIEDTGKFTRELEKLKELNNSQPDLKIKYSDFLLKIIDLKREIKPEDIEHAFNHIDAVKSGRITTKDLHGYLKRWGEDITEEEAKDMILKAGLKVSTLQFYS